jgi:hypothetical protein
MNVRQSKLANTVLAESAGRIVYVRPVAVSDLPAEVQAEAEGAGLAVLYAVHRSDGARLALVADRRMAFALAMQHDLAPVSAH